MKIAIFFSFLLPLFAIIKERSIPIPMTTSVIIPCHARHSKMLLKLLEAYANQTCYPDEVIISIGPSKHITRIVLQKLRACNWPFKLHLLPQEITLNASQNRNIAAAHASGDIIICQDADDLPHPQRIEIIKYLFGNYNIDHLIHGYTILQIEANEKLYYGMNDPRFNLDLISDFKTITWDSPRDHNPHLGANNAVAFRRELFQKIQWNPKINYGEDCDFNDRIFKNYENHMVIQEPLYYYFIHK